MTMNDSCTRFHKLPLPQQQQKQQQHPHFRPTLQTLPSPTSNHDAPGVTISSLTLIHESVQLQQEEKDRSLKNIQLIQQTPQSPLTIPEILQEICAYLDRSALVYASRVSKQFWISCEPLLWNDVPHHAWENHYFQSNWHKHGSQIYSLSCGPGVNLGLVGLHCRHLLSLDVSKIGDPMNKTGKREDTRIDTRSTNRHYHHLPSKIDENPTLKIPTQQPQRNPSLNSHTDFLKMAKDLIYVIENNKYLQCLQLKPIGRFPPPLLEALSKLDRLEFLSLNAWTDFQEYSLQLIMESCSSLLHLSLGENDFTRFTLETLRDSIVTRPRLSKSDPRCSVTGEREMSVRLERYDDPIKGRAGPFTENFDPLEIYSKQAVVVDDTPFLPISGSSSNSSDELQYYSTMNKHFFLNQQLSKHKQSRQSDPPQINIRKLSLHQTRLRQEFLVNLANLCPRLEHLSLLDGWGFYPTSRFASILSATCPNLSRLEFREQAMDLQDEFFVSLCQNIPKLQLVHAGTTGFSQGSLEAVHAHCRDIVSLNFDGARGIQSKTVDQLLRVCSSLKVLSANGVVLNARDLDPRSRWTCIGLETLVLDIEIYAILDGAPEQASKSQDQTLFPSNSHRSVKFVREHVYDQLRDLTRLKILGLGGGHRVQGIEAGVDLTLESGLEKLSTLHCLEILDIRRMARTQGEEDMAWMTRHWPRLCYLKASKSRYYRNGNDKTHKAIEWLSQARPGMKISLS